MGGCNGDLLVTMTQTESEPTQDRGSRRLRAAIVLGHAGDADDTFGITGVERVVQLLLEGFESRNVDAYTIYPGRGRLGSLFAAHSRALLPRQPDRRYDATFIDEATRFLEHHDIDIVLSIGLRQDFHLAQVCRRLQLPHIVHRPVALADEQMPWWRRAFYGAFDTWTLHQCREIIACSQASALRMRRTQGLAESKVVVVPNGVEFPQVSKEQAQAARAALGVPAEALMIVGVGQLIPRKSFHRLVEALGLVSSSVRQPLVCVLLGEGPERSRLEQTARRCNVTLHMPGFVDAPAHIVASADLSVLPSLAEGMPLVVLEAMALGVATIATNVAGTPEVIENGVSGLLVPAADVPALARAIESLAQDVRLRAQLARAGQQRTHAQFSVDAMVDGFVTRLQRHAPLGNATATRGTF